MGEGCAGRGHGEPRGGQCKSEGGKRSIEGDSRQRIDRCPELASSGSFTPGHQGCWGWAEGVVSFHEHESCTVPASGR